MRTIYMLIGGVFCLILSSSAQTILKPAPLSSLIYHDSTLSFDDTTMWAPRQQTKFMFGWQWAGGPNQATNARLHCNFFEDTYAWDGLRNNFRNIPDSGDTKYIVWQHLRLMPSMSGNIYHLNSMLGIQYDPTAKYIIDSADTFSL